MPNDVSSHDSLPGNTQKLGATLNPNGNGVNFAFYTGPEAKRAWVCLFDSDAPNAKETRIELHGQPVSEYFMDGVTPCEGIIWNALIPGIKEGQRYGFRVDGPFNPECGQTYHRNRLLLDPYAREVNSTPIDLSAPSLFNYDTTATKKAGDKDGEERFLSTFKKNQINDTAPAMPKAIVVNTDRIRKQVGRGTSLRPMHDSIILEAHVREATISLKDIPEKFRGTYKGLGSPEFIAWMKNQGYTTLELMPIQLDNNETHWGYMTSGFLATNPKYAVQGTDQNTTEQFAEAVSNLRKAGIETWMDVVFNHTAEGNHQGPVLNFKGLDERYYRKHDETGKPLGRYYYDSTGCGNTLNTDHPVVRRLLIHSLEHFHNLGVAGFRFDLMKTLGRSGIEGYQHRNGHRFYTELLSEIREDGKLQGVKLSGEPWDCSDIGGDSGLPPGIADWSAHDRNALRRSAFLPGGERAKVVASVIAGVGERVKYAVSHDGNLPADSVHTNRSDSDEHPVTDCGESAGWPKAEVEDERYRRQTFGIALEALAQGAVLRKLGADRGHSQNGNHNPYDLASEKVTRIPWGKDLTPQQQKIHDFSGIALRFKNAHPSLRRNKDFYGSPNPEYQILHKSGDRDMTWLHASGREMTKDDWDKSHEQAFGMLLSGDTRRKTPDGDPLRDVPLLALINASAYPVTMHLPASEIGTTWKPGFDSSGRAIHDMAKEYGPQQKIELPPFTVIAFESALEQHRALANAKPMTIGADKGLSQGNSR